MDEVKMIVIKENTAIGSINLFKWYQHLAKNKKSLVYGISEDAFLCILLLRIVLILAALRPSLNI